MWWFRLVKHYHEGVSMECGRLVVEAKSREEAHLKMLEIEANWEPEADDIYDYTIGIVYGPYFSQKEAYEADSSIPTPIIVGD